MGRDSTTKTETRASGQLLNWPA